MTSNIDCPCGHTVRVPDEMVNTRVKCPVCGELLSAASAQPVEEQHNKSTESPATPSASTQGRSDATPESPAPQPIDRPHRHVPANGRTRTASNFHGKGGSLFAGLPIPSLFTASSLTLLPQRVRIKSTGPFSSRRVDFRLSEVTSAEVCRSPNWYFLLLGILLLPANGVGLLLIIPFLIVRHNYLILRCGIATVAIRFKGDNTDACAIGDAILEAAQSSSGRR